MATGKKPEQTDHGLDLLLDYDGRIELLPGGYYMKFRIKRVPASVVKPHGLSYSFTLHDSRNKRVLGYDNAHEIRPHGRRGKRHQTHDHWHRTAADKGRPYAFTNAADLLADFYKEVSRVMRENGHELEVIGEDTLGE